jgi:site-specific DNA-cytosine methylase
MMKHRIQFTDDEIDLVISGLHALLAVKLEALQTLNEAGLKIDRRVFNERDFGIPQIRNLIKDVNDTLDCSPEEVSAK